MKKISHTHEACHPSESWDPGRHNLDPSFRWDDNRKLSHLDQWLISFDRGLKAMLHSGAFKHVQILNTLSPAPLPPVGEGNYMFSSAHQTQAGEGNYVFSPAHRTPVGERIEGRKNPAQGVAEIPLDDTERKKSAGLMRVNHVGEICAQSLYQGQALTTRDRQTQAILLQSAEEEVDHLIWCQQRLAELHSHTSYLNIFWYSGSFLMGMVFGLLPTATNLGFVAETEHQVMKHLEEHLESLPKKDLRSRAILEQMYQDEQHHATQAVQLGGEELPSFVKVLMKTMSKVMTTVAFWV